jgi:hypothetical protein
MVSVGNQIGFICRHFQHTSKIDIAAAKSVHPEAWHTLPKPSTVVCEFCVKFKQGLANFGTEHCIPNKGTIRHGRYFRKKKLKYKNTKIQVSWNDALCQLVNSYRRFEEPQCLRFL